MQQKKIKTKQLSKVNYFHQKAKKRKNKQTPYCEILLESIIKIFSIRTCIIILRGNSIGSTIEFASQ